MSNILHNGWDYIDVNSSNEALLKLAKQYGEITINEENQSIELLKAKNIGEGIRESFSYKFGLDEFPFHTDASFKVVPYRFIILSSIKDSSTVTKVIDLKSMLDLISSKELNYFKKSIFLLKTPFEQKIVKLVFSEKEKLGLRFDPNIMQPYNESAIKSLKTINEFIKNSSPVKIHLEKNKALIMDNWRCLHSRSKVIENDRTLKRINII